MDEVAVVSWSCRRVAVAWFGGCVVVAVELAWPDRGHSPRGQSPGGDDDDDDDGGGGGCGKRWWEETCDVSHRCPICVFPKLVLPIIIIYNY